MSRFLLLSFFLLICLRFARNGFFYFKMEFQMLFTGRISGGLGRGNFVTELLTVLLGNWARQAVLFSVSFSGKTLPLLDS